MNTALKSTLLDIARSQVPAERARTSVPEIENAVEPPPVDVFAWLDAMPVNEAADKILDALVEAFLPRVNRAVETTVADFQQIIGSRIGQRALTALTREMENQL